MTNELTPMWFLEATIKGCVKVHNTRRNTFQLAASQAAFRRLPRNDENASVYYDKPGSSDLHIKLFFKSETNAVIVHNTLLDWGKDRYVQVSLYGRVLQKDVTIRTVERIPDDELAPVTVLDYVHTDDDESPGAPPPSTVGVDVNDDNRHQMVEEPKSAGKIDRCHILQRKKLADDDPRKGWDRTNLIFLYQYFHRIYDDRGRSERHMYPSIVFYPECYPHKVPETPQWNTGEVDSTGRPLKELVVVMEFALPALLTENISQLRKGYEIVTTVAKQQCQDERRAKFTFKVQDPEEYAANLVERAYETFEMWRDEMPETKYPIETMLVWDTVKADMNPDDIM